jgi:Zn ribbon nucleic-acid-binding protein
MPIKRLDPRQQFLVTDERGVELGNCVDCGIAVAMRPREVEGWYRIPTQRDRNLRRRIQRAPYGKQVVVGPGMREVSTLELEVESRIPGPTTTCLPYGALCILRRRFRSSFSGKLVIHNPLIPRFLQFMLTPLFSPRFSKMKRSLFTGFLFLPFGTSVHICVREG